MKLARQLLSRSLQNGWPGKGDHFSLDQRIRTMCLTAIINCPEKRQHVRHNCEADIRWSQFNRTNFFAATLLNFSESGVYFETTHDLKPGTTIFLDMRSVPSCRIDCMHHDRPRLVSLGEVKRRVTLSGKTQSYFGVGVRYPFPD